MIPGEKNPHESQSGPLHIRPDVVRAARAQPFMSFEDVYDQLREIDADWAISMLADAKRYSHDDNQRQAFAAGVLHVLSLQLASKQVEELEEKLKANAYGEDEEQQ